jgi:hypothetical protein
MGQQQLLLLVLATVIVGLATVAGIQAFEQGSKRANQDALTNTVVKIASDMQAQAKKPEQFGGKGVDDLSNLDSDIKFSDMGYETESGSFSNHTGSSSDEYVTSDGECEITQAGSTTPLQVKCESGDAKVTVEVSSLDSDGISTTTQAIKS